MGGVLGQVPMGYYSNGCLWTVGFYWTVHLFLDDCRSKIDGAKVTMLTYTVTNPDGLQVRAQMITTNPRNFIRKMSNGESFVVYQTHIVSRNQLWGRLTNNPGDVQQEYACLSIANRTFARLDVNQMPENIHINPQWVEEVDRQLRAKGFVINLLPFV